MSLPIGCVPYLNARPLIYGIEESLTLCVPSRLADLLWRKQFAAGLVPIAEALVHDQYDLLDNVAIAANGTVKSVLLIHREPIEKLTRIAADTASRTSVMLLRVLLKEKFGIEPEFYPMPNGAKLSDHEAMLIIGDGAIWYAQRDLEPRARVWDLGEAWKELTGLPFVFAAWAGQRGVFGDAELAGKLRGAKANGLAHLEEIVQDTTEATPEFRREYLTKSIRFDLGPAEKEAVVRFQRYAYDMGLVSTSHDLRYIA